MDKIRILHTGDVHLDSPFSGLDVHKSEVRRNELRGTFTSLMTYARTENVDLLLIAGDLFDNGFATRETISLIIREISKLKCPVVISPGNHDCAGEGSVWKRNVFPENTYVFNTEELSSFDFPDIGVRVYGWAYERSVMRDNPVAGKKAKSDGMVNILSAHCDLTSPLSSSCPLTVGDLESFGADYNALAHIHNPTDSKYPERIAYCGCLEGRSFDETGVKGAILCELEKRSAPGAPVSLSRTRVRFSKRRYEDLSLAVDGAATEDELRERISSFISEKKLGDDTILRLKLTGNVDERLRIDAEGLTDLGDRLFGFTVEDATAPLWNAAALSSDPTIRGEFYRVLEPMLNSSDQAQRANAALALRYGLSALAGEDFASDTPDGEG